MDPGAELAKVLLADPAVRDFVETRIYPLVMPGTTRWPIAVYELASAERNPALAEPATSERAQYRVHCWAKDYDGMVSLAAAVSAVIDGYVATVGGLRFAVVVSGRAEAFEESAALYHATIEAVVNHQISA